MKYIDILKTLCDAMTVSGNEQNAHDAVKTLAGDVFDEICPDAVGNLILLRKCGKENAGRILLDAHMDEIGMMVRGVHDGGFVTVVNIGGLDRQILPASDVQLWGDKKTIPGVVAATPPHLYGVLENKTPDWNKLVIDTGCTKEELAELFGKALDLTVPQVERYGVMQRVLSLEELNLLLEYVYCSASGLERYEEILAYVEKMERTILAQAKIFPKT